MPGPQTRPLFEDDEVIAAACRVDLCQINKRGTFNFAAHRRIEHDGLIVGRTGAEPPPAD